jgi:hypothetical protein
MVMLQFADLLSSALLSMLCALRRPSAAAAGGGAGRQRSAFWQGTLLWEQPGYNQRMALAEVRASTRAKLGGAAQRTNVGAHRSQTSPRRTVLARM